MKRINQVFICIIVCLALWLCLGRAMADDVILNPGYIHGNVTIAGESLYRIYIRAQGCSGHSSSEHFYSTDTYDLTVHVEGSACDYTVTCWAYTNGGSTEMRFFPEQVTVQDGLTTVADFALTPGYITGMVSMAGGTIQSGSISFSYTLNGKTTTGTTPFYSDGIFLLPVMPGQGIRLNGNVTDSLGTHYTLASVDVDVAESETVIQNWTVQAGTAGIEGHIGFGSMVNFDNIYMYASGPDNSSKSVWADLTTQDYEFTGLLPGDWNLSTVRFYMNGWDDRLRLPRSNYTDTMTLISGETLENNIYTIPSFVNGRVRITGSKGIEDVSGGSVDGFGVYGNESQGGEASDTINPGTGDYDLVITRGIWNIYQVDLTFSQNDGIAYVNSELSFSDYPKLYSRGGGVSLLPQDVENNYDFDIPTGSATVNFTVEGGGLFNDPRVTGSCTHYDEASQPEAYSYVRAYGPTGQATEESVTFVGTPGTYDITASAYVDGSLATFGELGVLVIEGADISMDIGAPDMAMVEPEPSVCMPNDLLTVSGTATDTDNIVSIHINGTPVSFATTNNPADPNEIAFSHDLTLSPGTNWIETRATDTLGKAITDRRKVYLDQSNPTMAWTPEDGITVSDEQIILEGTATDDAKVAEILINGQQVLFSPTENPADLNEVAFSVTLVLAEGENEIQVTVRDACGNETSETHSLTMNLPCLPVDDLAAVAKSTKVQLAWTHRGGEAYHIYRRLEGGAFVLIDSVESDNYLDGGLTNGTTYYYVVRTVCTGEETTDSNEVSATPARRTR